ncbi:MAG: glycosyltransferase family 4 protein [Planctomycetes bacterium]|nr:glycosyltransferase family 4 protein [Planctomycetota bacterium]
MGVLPRARLLAQAVAGIALARHLRRAGVAHLHCHFAHAPTSVGMYAARQARLPFSFTGHANDIFIQRALLRRKLARASFVACITDWHAEFYRAIEPACAGRLHVVRCGVDLDEWRPPTADVRARPTFEVLTVCRLVENKGVDLLLDGLARLDARAARPWRLTVAGDGPERARLEARAAELGIAARVQWLGAVENARVRELMGSADVFALGCRVDSQGDRDGLPVVLMEAMACGLPVVCGELPALHELIEDGRTGIFFVPSRLDALATSLERLRTDAEFGERLRSAGRQRVEREFSLRTNVCRLEALVWSRVKAQPDSVE